MNVHALHQATAPSLPATSSPHTEQALEVALLPACDTVLLSTLSPGMSGTPRTVAVSGQITRSDDASYKRTIHFHKDFDAANRRAFVQGGISAGASGAALAIFEQFSYAASDFQTSGRVSDDGFDLPVNEVVSQRLGPDGLHVQGYVGDFDVELSSRSEGADRQRHEGWILHHGADGRVDGGVPFDRETILTEGGCDIRGRFGDLVETGTVRSEGPGRAQVWRAIGPYVIRQTVTWEP